MSHCPHGLEQFYHAVHGLDSPLYNAFDHVLCLLDISCSLFKIYCCLYFQYIFFLLIIMGGELAAGIMAAIFQKTVSLFDLSWYIFWQYCVFMSIYCFEF